MKLGEVFRFEVGLQLRRVSTWIYFAILLGFTYRLATEGYVGMARNGEFLFNGPFVIASVTMTASLIGLLVAAALAGDAGARDVQTRMHPLFYTAPVERSEYLGGRFLGALFVNALILLGAPLALLLATLSPGLEPELMGPFRPDAYLSAYFLLALPSAFIATALLFSIAALTRRAMASYIASALLFTMAVLSSELVARQLGLWDLAKLLDPFGMVVLAEMQGAWTAAEKSTVLIGLQGSMVANRLLWLAIGLGALAFTHRRFRLAHPVAGSFWERRARRREAARVPGAADDRPQRPTGATAGVVPITVPRVERAFGPGTRARQTLAIALRSFREIAIGWGGLAAAGMAVFLVLLLPSLINHLGVPLVPTTGEMIAGFTSSDLLWMFIPLLTAFYAGELVWGERDAGLSEMADAAPVPEWVAFLGKLAGLGLALGALQALMVAAAIAVQLRMGYFDIEIGLYARTLLGLELVDHLLFALLAMVVHVVVDHKYLGHMIVITAYAFMTFAPTLGIGHNLLVFGSDPGWSYSDIRGFGPSLIPFLWFKLYWAAWSLLLAVAARLLWVRGTEQGWRPRLRQVRRRLTRRAVGTAAAAVALIVGLGGFVFYNTNVLNDYRTASDRAAWRAEYERRYGHHEGAPQPRLTGTRLHVEIHPGRRAVEIRGTYRLVNSGPVAIDSVHLTMDPEVETEVSGFDRAATRVVGDRTFGYEIHVLERPLQPGDSLRLDLRLRFQPRGFTNAGIDPAVSARATWFDADDWLPAIGYQRDRELAGAGDRREHGLPPRPAVRSLDDVEARQDVAGDEWIELETVVGTQPDQTAVAPGALLRTWVEDGRRYFHYATDAPIRNDYALFSAAYAVREARWNGIAIEVYHHPDHAWNVDRMVRSVQATLAYHTERFGPYPYRQIRLVEHAGAGNSLHAYPINVSYQEGFSRFDPEADPRDIDFPFAVVAHEVAHQWWGNQLSPANVEGSPLLTESLAWYSALAVVEATYGRPHLERLLGMMREAYLAPRSRAGPPLLRASDRFVAYRRGPFAMYALREYVGAEPVDAALRRLLEEYPSGEPPLPTSMDLYAELETATPDSLRWLLADLFAANTYWELSAERVTAARMTADRATAAGPAAGPAEAGGWRVRLDVRARKVVVDSAGVETEVPMDDLIEIGVFAAAAGGDRGEPLYLRTHRVRSGGQRITVTVPGEPASAGIDPRGLLDAHTADNVEVVRPQGAGEPPSP